MGERSQLAQLRALITDHDGRPAPPIARLLGARVLAVDAGRVSIEFAVKDEFLTPGGGVQGGIISAYVDLCMALAAHTLFEPGQRLSTSSLTVSFLAPVTAGPVVGEGSVVKRGRSVVFLEAVLHDREGRECAHASSVGAVRARR
ncbi:MAG: PaaI family thioesterase [candidate division NC10 bacterium]